MSFNVVIQGFGHCGKNLHLRCIQKLLSGDFAGRLSNQIDIVDPFIEHPNMGHCIRFHRSLPPLSHFDGATPILHICTPPGCHLSNVREAIAAGYTYIIVEKPLAQSVEEAQAIEQLAASSNARVLVVAVWSNSSLVDAIKAFVERNDRDISGIEVINNKARFTRTLSRRDEHVFDIEMPHQISVVLPFMGSEVEFVSAQTSDLMINDACRSTMGRGEIILKSKKGAQARLVSSLSHPVRERSITIQFRGGQKLVGNFPVSGDDSYSQLFTYSHLNQLVNHEIYEDEPLTNCIRNYYEHFLKCAEGEDAPLPNGGCLHFNVKIVSLLDEAKREQENYPIHMQQGSIFSPEAGNRGQVPSADN